ncbi:MAG TPA: cupin domain-containing protein [Stellaceae bacterium]|nr:cupin domain-containing protein [Stellaceae bacterium]
MSSAEMKFSASHLKDARFEDGGLRSFFLYRDLGIREATRGRVMAHVIRAKSGHGGQARWHRHHLDFQMYYVIKGWIKFAYEGVGEVLAEAGSCVHQPPGIRHLEIAHSDDLELLEITLPAEFATSDVAAPGPEDGAGSLGAA